MAKLETVMIQNGDGVMIINKSDFDESKHKLYEESKPKTTARKKPATRKPKAK